MDTIPTMPPTEAGIEDVPIIVEEIHKIKLETNNDLRSQLQKLKEENSRKEETIKSFQNQVQCLKEERAHILKNNMELENQNSSLKKDQQRKIEKIKFLEKHNKELENKTKMNDKYVQDQILQKRIKMLESKLEKMTSYVNLLERRLNMQQNSEKLWRDFIANELNSPESSPSQEYTYVDIYAAQQASQSSSHNAVRPVSRNLLQQQALSASPPDSPESFMLYTDPKRLVSGEPFAARRRFDDAHKEAVTVCPPPQLPNRNAGKVQHPLTDLKSSSDSVSTTDYSVDLQSQVSSFSFSEDANEPCSSKSQKKKKRRGSFFRSKKH